MKNLEQKILEDLGRAAIQQDGDIFRVTVFRQVTVGKAWVVDGEYEDQDKLQALKKAYEKNK